MAQQRTGLVSLNSELISVLSKENQEILSQSSEADPDFDLSKEFRWKNYPIILLILKNPLKEFVSSLPPTPEEGYILFQSPSSISPFSRNETHSTKRIFIFI
jgi:hypothetical protein